MIRQLVRTKDELKAARQILGLSAEGLVAMVRMGDGRTVRRWESGESEIPGPVIVILETAMDFLRQKEEIRVQLEKLESGEMRSGAKTLSWGRVLTEDTTEKDIERLKEAEASLESALAILTRQPPGDGSPSSQVHWYNLRRLTYERKPGQKDEWSLPGETSPERALAYFEKDGRFSRPLAICNDADRTAEFLLEQRQVLRAPFGASHRLRAGDLIRTFTVHHAEAVSPPRNQ
jgi:transcriptional regulator with XRE-family HTH domain